MGSPTTTIRNSKLLTATSATTSRPLSSAKTRLTITLRLHPTNRESQTLQRLSNTERTTKSSSSTRQSFVQVKWVSCTAATSILRFESSPSKLSHLLGSFGLLMFKLATFRIILTHLPIQCRRWSGNPREWGLFQDPVPSSVVTWPFLDTPPTSIGYLTFRDL